MRKSHVFKDASVFADPLLPHAVRLLFVLKQQKWDIAQQTQQDIGFWIPYCNNEHCKIAFAKLQVNNAKLE